MNTCTLAAALLLATSPLALAHEWQVRRALAPDQKPEWTAAGYLPAWDVTPDATGDGFAIDGDKDGKLRGTVLVGTRITVPSPLAPSLRARLRYKTFCALDDPPRSGVPALALFTPEVWRSFEESATPSLKFEARSEERPPLYYAGIGAAGADVVEWRDWESGELRQRLRPYAGKELMLAFVWSAMHFHVEEWAAVEKVEIVTKSEEAVRREFYEAFDLTLPALAPAAAAAVQGDWAAAEAALAAHFRQRTTPAPPSLATSGSAEAADRIVAHEFQFVGCPAFNVGPEIKWNEDPFNYEQWAIALNRHSHWLTLGAAYAGTKDEKYAREFVAELRSWIAAMPVHVGAHWVEGPFDDAGKSPLSLDAGIRMGQTWFPAFYYFLHSPSFSDSDLVAMLQSFRDHALYLMDPQHFKAGSNWGAMEANGLLHIGCMLPEFRESAAWRDTAIERLHSELDNQVYADGAQMELTPGYHGVTLGNMLGAVEVARRCEVPLPDDFTDKLERMFDYYARIADPAGRTPPLNDSGASGVGGWLQKGLALFPSRADWRYLLTDGKEGTPPAYTSARLPDAGWDVMRSGWDRDACYLMMDAGPFGTGHQHEDKLSILVHAFDRPLLVEAGTYSYDVSEWRKYVLSTRAHNTVMVDGLDQRRAVVRESWKAAGSAISDGSGWLTTDAFDFASAAYTQGYGRDENVPVEHRRSVLFLKPRLWLVVDELHPTDGKPHRYESLFHLDAPDARADQASGTVVTQDPAGANLALIPVQLDGWQVEVVKGQERPVVQGWLPTGKHNVLRPVPTAVYHRTAGGDPQLAYFLVPLREGEPVPTVAALPTEGASTVGSFAARIVGAEGAHFTLLWNGNPGRELRCGGLRTSARVALFADADRPLGEVP